MSNDTSPSSSATNPSTGGKSVETWAQEKATPAWKFRAAQVSNHWARGRELSEADFDAALAKLDTHKIGPAAPEASPKS